MKFIFFINFSLCKRNLKRFNGSNFYRSKHFRSILFQKRTLFHDKSSILWTTISLVGTGEGGGGIIDSAETVKSVDEPSYQADFLPRFSRSPRQSWRSSKRDRNQARGINIEMNWFPSHYLSWRGIEDASETRFVYSVRVSIEARRGEARHVGRKFLCVPMCENPKPWEKPSQNLRSLRGCNPRSGWKYSRSFYEVNSSLRQR